jgi:hypothetical protein
VCAVVAECVLLLLLLLLMRLLQQVLVASWNLAYSVDDNISEEEHQAMCCTHLEADGGHL